MENKLLNEWKASINFVLLLLLVAALFFSRAVLSLSTFAFVAFNMLSTRPGKWFRTFVSTPILWSMSLLFFLPLLSAIWSADNLHTVQIARIKLPLLLFPLAFACSVNITKKQWHLLAYSLITLLVITAGIVLVHFVQHFNEVNDAYLRAGIMNTPLGNDHVRYSWLLSLGSLLSILLAWENRKGAPLTCLALSFAGLFLLIILHMLAARTGLLCFYVSVLALLVYLLIRKMERRLAGTAIISILFLPILAYGLFPTLRNRIQYVKYDLHEYQHGNIHTGANDGNRLRSIEAGITILNEHPISGTGFGDVRADMDSVYAKKYPDLQSTDRILPSSEWIMYGAGTGWPGLLIFTWAMFSFCLVGLRRNIFWVILNLSAALSFLFDIGLEVQYGVFIYSFIITACWKYIVTEKV